MVGTDDLLNARILIVDDQETNVMLLEQILSGAGYRAVTSTTDPHAVCALHRDNDYDLILLDLQMPGMDGFEVMEGLKVIEADGYLPVLVITAQPGHKLRALQAGARDFISKPFDLLELRTRIHNMLEVRLLYRQLEQYSRALESLALHDALTGLPNRRLLFDRLELAIAHAHRNKSSMAVLYLDLDGFKQINDTLGHDAGDALLAMVANRLVSAVRQEDTVARLSGDEFVIALWEMNHPDHADHAATLAAKLILALALPYSIQGRSVNVTASIGVALYSPHGETAQTLMKRADTALYEAKRNGRNGYCFAASLPERAMAHA